MKIMKRDGSEATFDRAKIEKAIEKANASVIEKIAFRIALFKPSHQASKQNARSPAISRP